MSTQPHTAPSRERSDQASLLLGIDCATAYLALTLVEKVGQQVAAVSIEVGRDHAARLIPELEQLLSSAGASSRDVAAIGVGVGPGSYTGVRVAVASARGLARAWGVPLGGSVSLLTLLPADLSAGTRALALLDARRDNVYAALAERNHTAETRFTLLEGPLKVSRQELEDRFPGVARFEAEPPNAAVLAWTALDGGSSDALYL